MTAGKHKSENNSRVTWRKTQSSGLLDTHVAHSDTPNRSLTFSLISAATETQRKVPLLGFPVWFALEVQGNFGLKKKQKKAQYAHTAAVKHKIHRFLPVVYFHGRSAFPWRPHMADLNVKSEVCVWWSRGQKMSSYCSGKSKNKT